MNELRQTVVGKNADEVEARAKDAVLAYFGTLAGIEWEVVSDAQQRLDGSVLMYEGRVYAKRDTP